MTLCEQSIPTFHIIHRHCSQVTAMTNARPGSRFWPWSQPRPTPAEPDPADYGTCFGLEMSLPDPDELPSPAGRDVTPGKSRLSSSSRKRID